MTSQKRNTLTPATEVQRDEIAQRIRSFSCKHAPFYVPKVEATPEAEMVRFVSDPDKTPCSRQIVRSFIGMLAGQSEPQEQPLSKDLSSMGQFFSSLAESVEQSIITQDEAEALIQTVLEGFVSRRFYKTLRGLANPGKSWFMTAFHHHHHGE